MPPIPMNLLRLAGLGVVVTVLSGCAGTPAPEAFQRAQSATAARVAAGIPAPEAEPVEVAAEPRRRVRTRVVRSEPAPAAASTVQGRAGDDARTEARERHMRQVMRGVCPSCLGPEPVFHLDDRARRAAPSGGDHENTGKAAPRSTEPQAENGVAGSSRTP
jgi:hypothetical protein